MQACTMLQVHEIYSQLPCKAGPVVENPDGGLAYAAPPTAPGQQRMAQP